MGCLSDFAKYILFVFNLLIVACGIALIALGSIILADENKGVEAVTNFSVGGFAIAVGVIIFLIAFFGCCGAIKENSCMLTTYAIILILLFILQVVLGALAFVAVRNNDGSLDKAAHDVVEKIFDAYVQDPSNQDKKKVVDTFQHDFKCCGVNNAIYWTTHGLNIPDSCYPDSGIKVPYIQGCAEGFKDALVSNGKYIGGVAIAFAVVELLGAIFAFMVRSR